LFAEQHYQDRSGNHFLQTGQYFRGNVTHFPILFPVILLWQQCIFFCNHQDIACGGLHKIV
jgi:hypothetical protein